MEFDSKSTKENATEPYMLIDQEGNILEANEAARNLFEYGSSEITSATMAQLLIKKEEKASRFSDISQTSGNYLPAVGIKKSGEEFSLHYQSSSASAGKKERLIRLNFQVSVSPVTERRNVTKPKDYMDSGHLSIFEKIFFENPSPGWIINAKDFKILTANRSALDKYGYSEKDFLSLNIQDILPQEEKQRFRCLIEKNGSAANFYKGNWKNITKSGEKIHLNIHTNIQDHDRLILLANDVTREIEVQKQKDFALTEKEALFNTTQDQICSVDREYNLLAANESFIKLLKKVTGQTFKPGDNLREHPFTSEFISMWNDKLQRALEGESVKEVAYILGNDQLPTRWLEIILNASIKNNEVIGVVCYFRNITDAKLAEQRLIESETNLREAQRLAKLGNWSRNLITGEIFWSDQLYDIFELDKTDPGFNFRSVIYLIDKEDRQKCLLNHKVTMASGKNYSIVYHITTPSGKKKIIQEIGYGQKDKNGTVWRIFGSAQDITQNRRIEEALRHSYEKYHLVAKATNDSIWDWDIITDKVSRSGDGFKILFGYENDFANTKETIYNQLIHPEDVQYVLDSHAKTLEDPKQNYWEAKYRFRRSDGTYAHVFDRGHILRCSMGKPLRMIGASQDVTIQTEQLQEITRIQQNLHALINTTGDMIWSLDTQYNIITSNKAFNEVIQSFFAPGAYREGETLLKPLVGQKELAFWKSLYDRALKGESFETEFNYFSKLKNHWIYSIISLSPIINKENRVTGVACFAKDITDLKLSAEELKHSEQRFRDLFHSSPQPMWLYEHETLKIIEINQAGLEQYGYTEEEFSSMTIRDLRPKTEAEIDLHIPDEKNTKSHRVFNEKFKHRKKNGDLIDVQIFSTPLEIQKKKYSLVIAIDETEKTKFEHNINKAIIQAQENERFEIGSELHDNICQLLASSKMRLSILKQYIPAEKKFLYDESSQYLVSALEEIRNLSHRLAPSFFNDKTLEEAFFKLFNSINISDKFDIHLNFSDNVNKRNISLELKLNLYRILQEQLRNILKYAKACKIILEVKLIRNELHMRTCDNGVGFNLSSVKSGIGLGNIKRRVELFSGTLVINSSPGNGTEFLITIPLE